MTPVSRKTFVAIEAVAYIACHAGDKPVRGREICEYQDVTLRYLEHILQALVRAGVLKGIRGPKGGYVLARERRKIPLSDIHDAVQSPGGGEEGSASPIYRKALRPLQEELRREARTRLAALTLQDICDRVGHGTAGAARPSRQDFTI